MFRCVTLFFLKKRVVNMGIKPCNKAPNHINPLNTKLNPIYHLLALVGDDHILHVSSVRVKEMHKNN
jgi:hypothetical protein